MTISPKAIDAAIQVLRERDDQFGIRLYANERRAIAEAVMAAAAPHIAAAEREHPREPAGDAMKPRTDIPDGEGALLHLVADLLYEQDDPRATQWPTPAALGLIRSRVRGIADSAVDGVIRSTSTCEIRRHGEA